MMGSVVLRFDAERELSQRHCDNCGRDYALVKGFLFRDEDPYAVFFAACHRHDGESEAWIDVILGTLGQDDSSDHVTFGCRVGPVDRQSDPAATLVNAAAPYSDAAMFGRELTRSEALVHPWLANYWAVVDFILLEDDVVHRHVYV